MDPTTERLIALQDLLQLKRDLQDRSYGELGFPRSGGSEVTIEAEIESLKGEIDRGLLKRFETIARKYDRPLVPVRKGVCYGCFVRYPTAKLAELESEDPVTCDSCGRLLYRIA